MPPAGALRLGMVKASFAGAGGLVVIVVGSHPDRLRPRQGRVLATRGVKVVRTVVRSTWPVERCVGTTTNYLATAPVHLVDEPSKDYLSDFNEALAKYHPRGAEGELCSGSVMRRAPS